jgi:hypothetical protein
VCTSVDVDIEFNSQLTWIEIIAEDFPTETWYTATLFHSFQFEMVPDLTLISQAGSRSQLTVRRQGDTWRLVEWRDLGSDSSSATSQATTTWGGIKALYL